MDPAMLETLAALVSGDPQRVAMAVDGLMVLAVPFVGRAYVAAVNRRPPNRRKGIEDGRLLAAWRAVYMLRRPLVKALPHVLMVLSVAVRVGLALYLDLDVLTEAGRGVFVALAGVGAHEWRTSGTRVRTAEIDVEAASDGGR